MAHQYNSGHHHLCPHPGRNQPGQFPYKHDPPDTPLTDLYQIPLANIGVGPSDDVYIAAHVEGTDGETCWGKGIPRKMKVELHLPQIEDPNWPVDYDLDGDIDDDAQKRWWPTNALQGDETTFDMRLWLNEDP